MHRALALCSASPPASVRSLASTRRGVFSVPSFLRSLVVGTRNPPRSTAAPRHRDAARAAAAAARSFDERQRPHRRRFRSGVAAEGGGAEGVVFVDERDPAGREGEEQGETGSLRMSDDLDSSRSRVVGEEIMYGTKWLAFKHLTYVDPTGKERAWDMMGRATRAEGASADAVCVFATLRKKGEEDTTLLVRQFRPPMRGETIELPAGLIDGAEAPEIAALRELKEETGYVAGRVRACACMCVCVMCTGRRVGLEGNWEGRGNGFCEGFYTCIVHRNYRQLYTLAVFVAFFLTALIQANTRTTK